MSKPITKQQYIAAYEAAASVYDGRIAKEYAAAKLEAEMGFNLYSVLNFINDYKHMMRGETFKRAMSVAATDCFLSGILRDRGIHAFSNAIKSVRLTIDYYENTYHLKRNKLRAMVEAFESKLRQQNC